MDYILTTVPTIFGRSLNVWLALLLFGLIMVQISLGMGMYYRNMNLIAYHRLNAFIIATVVSVHTYYVIGIAFFGFHLAK